MTTNLIKMLRGEDIFDICHFLSPKVLAKCCLSSEEQCFHAPLESAETRGRSKRHLAGATEEDFVQSPQPRLKIADVDHSKS